MSNLFYQEVLVNATRGCRFYESEIQPAPTEDVGELFRLMRSEYGPCSGSVYVDRADGTTRKVGWVFKKRVRYEGSREAYDQESWVTLYNQPVVSYYDMDEREDDGVTD